MGAECLAPFTADGSFSFARAKIAAVGAAVDPVMGVILAGDNSVPLPPPLPTRIWQNIGGTLMGCDAPPPPPPPPRLLLSFFAGIPSVSKKK